MRKLESAIEQALRPSKGGRCSVAIRYRRDDAAAYLQFGEEWTVRPSRELVERLGQLVGRDGVEVIYGPRAEGWTTLHERRPITARPARVPGKRAAAARTAAAAPPGPVEG